MKKITSFALSLSLLAVSFTQSGCFGSFTLTQKLYKWNNSIVSSKIGKNVVFWILGFAQIYSIAGAVDIFFFNVLEFWTGKNPLAMAEGEFEIQVVTGKDGNKYQITASRNRFEIKQLDGENAGKLASISFNQNNKQWTASVDNKTSVVAEMVAIQGKYTGVKIFKADGTVVKNVFDEKTSNEVTAVFNENIYADMASAK